MTARSTKSGIFVKTDPSLGALAFSPFTGAFFAIAPEDADPVERWLDAQAQAPSREYSNALSYGWLKSTKVPRFPLSHLLPCPEAWTQLPTPSEPIVVNWFVTGSCPLHCGYCYAEDLMRGENEPSWDLLARSANAILKLSPLAVVLTGGEPLGSPHLASVVRLLSGKVGLIVDTNGVLLTDAHLALFREHRVVVRVSLDSDRPVVNGKFRSRRQPAWKSSAVSRLEVTQRAVDAVARCIHADVPVAVQTVATKDSLSGLLPLGDKLFRLGVRSWRIHRVAPSKRSLEGFKLARCADKPYAHCLHEVHEALRVGWSQAMFLESARNDIRNSVLLVGPDGVFYTESNVPNTPGKVVVHPARPHSPSLAALSRTLDMSAHASRYLNTVASL